MAVPKRKTSPSAKGMRQGRQRKLAPAALMENPETGTLGLRHHAVREADGALWFKGKLLKPGKTKAQPAEAAEAQA